MNKLEIGVGIITYEREEYFDQVYNAVPMHNIGKLVVVNDGAPYKTKIDKGLLIQHTDNIGVGKSKNEALQYLINQGCKYLFLIEDDVIIKDENVFEQYIKVANVSGIHHLNFQTGELNTLQFNFTYEDGTIISVFRNPQAHFSYFFSNVIKKLGVFDPNYKNAFEHIDIAYRYAKAGIFPPFWYFPDFIDSYKYLELIKGSSENSSITNKPKYQENWTLSAQHFIRTHGCFTNEIPEVGNKAALAKLIEIQKLYGNKYEIIPHPLFVQSTETSTIVPGISS